jgi:predicted ATP-grasp superfamily ATP-dependent carboligase
MSTTNLAQAPFLVVAVTGRALAASARRGGYAVVVLDYFADADTAALASACRSVVAARGLRFDRPALLAAAEALAPAARCAGLVYGSGFEGRIPLLARVAHGRRLFGNSPAVVSAVRDPVRFFGLLDRLGIPHPRVRLTPPPDPTGWLVKHPGGAGGTRVRRAGSGRVSSEAYFQRFEPGRTLSALFLADGRRARILGFNEQWTAARFRPPFLYGGAVGGITPPLTVGAEVPLKLDALVAATGLVGLNGLDFIVRGDEWSVLELNPRPTATMELYDPDYSHGLFDWHLRACEGELPAGAARSATVRAHAVIRAPAEGRLGAAFEFPRWCRDRPRPGTGFVPGDPVCTVHASAPDAPRAVALLRRRQAAILDVLRQAAA